MIVVIMACAVLLAAGGILAVVRAERGPSMLDRTIALDVLTATLVSAIALEAAWSRRTVTIPILVVLSLVGFISSVTIARFAAVDPEGGTPMPTAADMAAEDAERIETLAAEREAASDPEHHGGPPDGEVR